MDVRSAQEDSLPILLTRSPPTPQVILDFSREIDVELIDRVVNACFFGSGQEVGASFIAPPLTTHLPTTATCSSTDPSTVPRTSRCLATCPHDSRRLQQLTSQGSLACRFARPANRSRPVVQYQMYSPYSISVFKFLRSSFRRAGRQSRMINEQVCSTLVFQTRVIAR